MRRFATRIFLLNSESGLSRKTAGREEAIAAKREEIKDEYEFQQRQKD